MSFLKKLLNKTPTQKPININLKIPDDEFKERLMFITNSRGGETFAYTIYNYIGELPEGLSDEVDLVTDRVKPFAEAHAKEKNSEDFLIIISDEKENEYRTMFANSITELTPITKEDIERVENFKKMIGVL